MLVPLIMAQTSDEELMLYLLQLVQSLRFNTENAREIEESEDVPPTPGTHPLQLQSHITVDRCVGAAVAGCGVQRRGRCICAGVSIMCRACCHIAQDAAHAKPGMLEELLLGRAAGNMKLGLHDVMDERFIIHCSGVVLLVPVRRALRQEPQGRASIA